MKSDLVDITTMIFHQTDAAILVSDDATSEKVWLPKSQCELEREEGRVYTVTLPEWLAIEKGLI